jgi:hypothetical protein
MVIKDMPSDWTAQIGAYDAYSVARHQAILLQGERHARIARVVRVVRHRHQVWEVQLKGLTESGARETCARLGLRDKTCVVVAPRNEVLAMRKA